MKSKLLNLSGAEVLSKESQKTIYGKAKIDLSLCGCSCSGAVTGPWYCSDYIGCPQVYTCNDAV
ncbi:MULTISPECIES: hypothetical protein [Flavobacterium]|uniref:Natural product n=1 Tax=Flavobacterium hankyongi TaxID=1176532 RepID=A0ABP8ZZ50_9FLAO|nr:hypothetical protein [Flavobacterium sp. N1846]